MSFDVSLTISPLLLGTLHRIHRQRNDLQGRLRQGPKQVQAGAANVAAAKTALADAKEAYKLSRVAVDQQQLQLKSRETRVLDLKVKLNQAQNNREYQAIKEQIAADEQANSVLSDEILEALEGLDQHQATIKRLQEELVKKESDQQGLEKQVAERHQLLTADLQRADAELAEAEAQLPPEMKREYQRIIAGRGEDALAPVDGECCGGCFQTLNPQVMNRLHMKQLVPCPACGALLYLGEERGLRAR
jgi:predicted  nucleic acid-binding Zn-ribbon protein